MSGDHTAWDATLRDMVGGPPTMPTMFGRDDMAPIVQQVDGRRTSRSGKLNTRAVSDVLELYGLDPIEELAEALVKKEPVYNNDGEVRLNPDGTPMMKPLIPLTERLKLLQDLAQYTRPKLKAVEVTTKAPELTDDQIERRLEALLAKQAAK